MSREQISKEQRERWKNDKAATSREKWLIEDVESLEIERDIWLNNARAWDKDRMDAENELRELKAKFAQVNSENTVLRSKLKALEERIKQ